MSGYIIENASFFERALSPALYVVATPIGNLSDITIRALETLSSCDMIACEDTRVTGKLLKRFGIKKRMVSYHEYNAESVGQKLIAQLQQGKSIALVSDAGTPLVSDPGFKLIGQAIEAEITVVPIPGCSAPMAALVASGLPTDGWHFAGFLPPKQVARKKRMQELLAIPTTLILFESPKRLSACLQDLVAIFGSERPAAVCRELTKLHEEIARGSLTELCEHFDKAPKGEIVIVIGPEDENSDEIDVDTLLRELLQTMPVSQAAAEAAQLSGLQKRELYKRALALKEETGS